MKKLILIITLGLLSILSFGQRGVVTGDTLKIRGGGKFGSTLDVGNSKIINVNDPTNPQDAVNLKYFEDNALVAGMVFDSIMWDTNISDLTVEKGKLYLDSAFQSLRYSPDGINSILVGRMMLRPLVYNNSGLAIGNLKVVYINGSFSEKLSIELADRGSYERTRMIGVTTEAIASGSIGNVTRTGLIQGNTTGLYTGASAGDDVYLENNGDMTNQPATGGDFNVYIGFIKKIGVTDGELYIDPSSDNLTAEINSVRGWSEDVVLSTLIAPDSNTRTFSVIGSGYTYENGFKYEWNNPSVVWDDTEGTVDIYFDKGVLVASSNLSESEVRSVYSSKAGVSRIYWDAINDTIIFANDMRHTFDMNGNTWATIWDTHGCIVLSGLELTNIVSEGNGNSDSHAQFGHGAGAIRNQDIITNVPLVTSTVGYTVFYRDGLNNWRSIDGAPFPVITTGSGRLAWNEDVGGSWQLSEVGNNDFVLCHLFASNTLGDKTGTVIGQSDYATLGNARDGAKREINSLLFSQFPIQELTPVATLIFQTGNGYGNAVKGRVRQSEDQFGDLVDYIDWRTQRALTGSIGGSGASAFDDLNDTPSVKTGSDGKGVVVSGTDLIYAEVARTINGESPTSGNYNISLVQQKIGNIVSLNTSGTGSGVDISVVDSDSDPTNENQDLSNSKLNNTVTIDISNGISTTITNIPRIDFSNEFDLANYFNSHLSARSTFTSVGNTTLSTNSLKTVPATQDGAISSGEYALSVGSNTGSKSAIFGGDIAIDGNIKINKSSAYINMTDPSVGVPRGSWTVKNLDNSIYHQIQMGDGANNYFDFFTSESDYGYRFHTSEFLKTPLTVNETGVIIDTDLDVVNGAVSVTNAIGRIDVKSTAVTSSPVNSLRFLDANGVEAQFIQGGNGSDNTLRIVNQKAGINLYHNGDNESDLVFETTNYGTRTKGTHDISERVTLNGTDGVIRYGFNDSANTQVYIQGFNGGGDNIYYHTRVGTNNYNTNFTGNITAANDVNCVDLNYSGILNPTSDKRVKDSITKMVFDHDKFLNLNPVSYYYKYDKKKSIRSSFLAQELDVLYPNLVNYSQTSIVVDGEIIPISSLDSIAKSNITDEDRLHTIDPMSIIPLNTLATQKALIKCDSLKLIVDDNKLQIEVLKSLIKNLDDRLNLLEN